MHQYSIRYNADNEVEMQFEKLDIVNLVVVIGLCISLIMAIFYDQKDLSTNIAVGLLGWLGGITTGKDITK